MFYRQADPPSPRTFRRVHAILGCARRMAVNESTAAATAG
jgi:hypothetical protein